MHQQRKRSVVDNHKDETMSHVIKTYDEDIKQAIFHQHNKALKSAEKASGSITEAVTDRRATGALIDKAKQSHPQDIRKFLMDGMSPMEISNSLSAHRTGLIRPDALDKAQLVFSGILKHQAIEYNKEPIKKPRPTMFRAITKAVNLVKTAAKDHDCAHWTEDEREVTKRALLPLVELYKELES
jgi:hypothetical protein